MVKKIGSFLILIFTYFSVFAFPTIDLKLVGTNGAKVKVAGIGVPFILEMIISGLSSDIRSPQIEGLDSFYVQNYGTSSNFSTINGVVSITKKYRYLVRGDYRGYFEIGPVKTRIAGKIVQSNKIIIKVASKQKLERSRALNKKPLLKLSLEKKEAFVGEKLDFNIRFYFDKKTEYLENIIDPTFNGFNSTKLDGPNEGKQKIGNDIYNYLEWNCKLYPKEHGNLVIPSVKAIYMVLKKNKKNSGYSLFDDYISFMGSKTTRKHIYSNSLELNVKPLPKNKDIKAIGKFNSIKIVLDRYEAKEGEGVVLKLEISGDGNFNYISSPRLTLPNSLKYYESKNYDNSTGKVYEYIVQGVKAGDWKIPAQEFEFLDVEDGVYKKLVSGPLSLKIVADNNRLVSSGDAKVDYEDDNDYISGIDVEGNWKRKEERKIPPLIFFAILVFVFFIWLFVVIKNILIYYKKNKITRFKTNKPFRLTLEKLKNVKLSSEIFYIFLDLFSSCFNLERAAISNDIILAKMRELGVKDDKIDEWNRFFISISEYAFFSKDSSSNLFVREAEEWIRFFEKLLI